MPPTLKGHEFHDVVLKKAKYIVAPMVDASELAWRMLARRYGAELCYTPMWHSGVFVRDEKYRVEALKTCPEDRPLIVQFCANDPETFRRAVELTLEKIECDAIDLNLGCPQVIAKRGHFGSFLQDEWELITKMVRIIHDNFSVPITCKLRIFDDLQRTIEYAKMMESAGAQILTVHGRTREQKGALTGLANWEYIKAVREAVSIPVFANGNIQYLEDVKRCIDETGVQGVMSAESHLTNPALFAGINPPVWQMCLEYLDLVDQYPCPLSYGRGHIFKMLHHLLQIPSNFDVREMIAKGGKFEIFRAGVELLKERYLPYHLNEKEWIEDEELKVFQLKHPPWICQPYVRPSPEEHLKKLEILQERDRILNNKRMLGEEEPQQPGLLSKKKQKRLAKKPKLKFAPFREEFVLCKACPNIAGKTCDSDLCKSCCKQKCYKEELDCVGHKIQIKSKRQAARKHNENDTVS